ncbi:cell wall-binding repeat-containing protein, partial [Clostridioides difficile]
MQFLFLLDFQVLQLFYAGKDRFETNKKVIQRFYKGTKKFYVSQGYKLVDAVVGSPLAK